MNEAAMLEHCAKLIKANETAYVDPDALAMAHFIVDRHAELIALRNALPTALDLFDNNWCTAHGHAPSQDAFDAASELRKLTDPNFRRALYP